MAHSGLGSKDEIRLLEHLFDRQGYNPLVRPVANLSDAVRVQLGMALIQLIDVVFAFSFLSIYIQALYFDNVVR